MRMAPGWPRVIQLNLVPWIFYIVSQHFCVSQLTQTNSAPGICFVTIYLKKLLIKTCMHLDHHTPWKSQQSSFSVFSCSSTRAPFTLLHPHLILTSLINLLSLTFNLNSLLTPPKLCWVVTGPPQQAFVIGLGSLVVNAGKGSQPWICRIWDSKAPFPPMLATFPS